MKNILLIAFALLTITSSSCTKYITDVVTYKDTTYISDTSHWVYPALNSGWSTNDSGNSIRYKLIDSVVMISGISQVSIHAENIVFSFPLGCRPIQEVYTFASTTAGTPISIIIYPNGQVYIQNPPTNGDAVSFDNIRFPIN